MKNYVQTPKQRRVDMAKQKQCLQASKPVIQFEQRTSYGGSSWTYTNRNLVHHINGKR